MSTELIIAIVAAVVVAAVIVAFVAVRRHPENAAGHDDTGTRADLTGRGTQPGEVVERPAGPDAETQSVDPDGGIGGPGRAGPPAGAGQAPEEGPSEQAPPRTADD